MQTLIAFTKLNFVKIVRERSLWGALLLLRVLLGACLFLSILSLGEGPRVLLNAALSSIEISALLLLIFSLTFGFYEDKNGRMMEIYLSCFPEYIYTAAKYISYAILSLIYLASAAILLYLLLLSSPANGWQAWAGAYSLFLKMLLFIGVNLLFCSLLSSAPLALLNT